MQIARVRLFSLFGAMLFLLNLLTSNVIYHNICILSTLILKNLMYLKSIDELPTPFPLSAFITYHSLSLPSVAFHYLLSPFIAFHYLSSPPHLIVRPLSALPRFVLTSPHFVLTSPRFVLALPRFVLPSPRFVLTSLPFCPHLAPFRSLTMPPHSPASHLLPSCFITPFVSHIRLSRTIVCAPFFYSPILLPLFYSLHCFYSLPLFYVLCFTSSPFALLTPLFYTALLYSLPLFTPPSLYLLPLFCTRFLLPGNLRKPVPGTAKGNVFLIFQRNFAKSP